MIEPTDEMRRAFADAAGWPPAPWTFGPDVERGLAAVLALVERDYTIRPRLTDPNLGCPRDHDFRPSDDPNFGAAIGGSCAALVNTRSGRVQCGWPRIAHRTPPQ